MRDILLPLLCGLGTGVLSAWGVGGGTLLLLCMTLFLGVDQRQAQAINLLFFLPTAAASLIFHVKGKQVQWRAAVPAILAGLVTAAAGAWVASVLEARLLRKVFGAFLLVVGVLELRKKPKGRRREAYRPRR